MTLSEAKATFFLILATLTGWLVVTATATAQVVSAPGKPAVQQASATKRQPTSIVAVVNAEPITQQMLANESVRRYGKDMLDSMINKSLILQECQRRGIQVSGDEVREEIVNTAKKFSLDVASYLKLLEENRDITPDQYSREIIWPQLALRKLVADQVQVGQEEFDRAYLSQYGEAIKCRMILVADEAEAKRLHAQVKANPAQFGLLAKQHSQDSASASVRGLIPPIRRFTGDDEIEQAVFALQDNEISDVLRIGSDYCFFQVVRRLPEYKPTPEQEPIIRQQIIDRLRFDKVRAASGNLFSQLQTQAKVQVVLGDESLTGRYPDVAAMVNGQQVTIDQVAGECIKRHGKEVLKGEIHRKILTQALEASGKQVTQVDLDAEINKAAIAFGFIQADGSADIEAWMNQVTEKGKTPRELYIADVVWPSVALAKLVEDSVTLTEEEIRRGYESNYGPRAEVLAIVLPDQKKAEEVWGMARDNPTENFFGKLAEQYSVEPVSQGNFGKVPPIRRFGGQPILEQEAFRLNPGELSGIVATGDRYIIMRLQGFTQPVATEFNEVRDELVSLLREKKLRDAMNEKMIALKESAQIDNMLESSSQLGSNLR